jgi:hypothetical protein
VLLLFYTAYAYSKVTNNDWGQFVLWEACIVVFLGMVQYLLIAGKGRFISQIAIDINMADEYINLKTSAFNGPFWFKKTASSLRFKKTDTKVIQIKNRYPGIFTESKHMLLLSHKGREIYLIPDYFNWRLEQELLKMNVLDNQ